ncbi:MAG TPA: hypothetical protein VII57_02130 [Dehalococcoidia bacterium]
MRTKNPGVADLMDLLQEAAPLCPLVAVQVDVVVRWCQVAVIGAPPTPAAPHVNVPVTVTVWLRLGAALETLAATKQ